MSPSPFARLHSAHSDQRLIAAARRGDERAFETVVRRHRRGLLRYCRRLGLSDSRAEDVVQQALLQAWLALERGREVSSPKAWLYRSVHNTAVNVMRSSRQETALMEDGAQAGLHGSAESDFERRLAVRETLSDVAALPSMQRRAILLSAVDGRSHDEVASALGVTNGAVRGLLYRARTSLRDAAAAFLPQPLLAWIGTCLARVAPSATRLAEMPPGGGDMGGAIAKGVALAGSAALLAVGTGVVPVQRTTRHQQRTAVLALGAVPGAPATQESGSDASPAPLPGNGALGGGPARAAGPSPGDRAGATSRHVAARPGGAPGSDPGASRPGRHGQGSHAEHGGIQETDGVSGAAALPLAHEAPGAEIPHGDGAHGKPDAVAPPQGFAPKPPDEAPAAEPEPPPRHREAERTKPAKSPEAPPGPRD
jgi:RNA polymerase sigma factor (sigma-70 family)